MNEVKFGAKFMFALTWLVLSGIFLTKLFEAVDVSPAMSAILAWGITAFVALMMFGYVMSAEEREDD